MKGLQFIFLALAIALSNISFAGNLPDESPQTEAIRLVMQARRDEIRKLDNPTDWWADTKERTWSAKRPFGPGTIDSTHFFQVSYAIDGKIVGTWSVNTRTGKVAGSGEPIRID